MLAAHGASRPLSQACSVAKQPNPPTHANTRIYRTRIICSATICLSARFRCGSCHTSVAGTCYPGIPCTRGSCRYVGTWLYIAGILRIIGTRGLHQVYEYWCMFLVRVSTYLAKNGSPPPMTQNGLSPQLAFQTTTPWGGNEG